MTPIILPVTEFRTRALEIVRRAQKQGQEYVITSKGKPAAVVMNFDEWESLIETLEIKQDKKLMQRIRKGIRYFERGGKGIPLDKIDWS